MDNPRQYQNEPLEIETMAECLQRQMKELGAKNYWEAVHLYAERESQQGQSLSRALFGFDLF